MKINLLDADSIIHIVAYHYAAPQSFKDLLVDDSPEEQEKILMEFYNNSSPVPVIEHVDSFLRSIFAATGSTHYHGFLGHRAGSGTFRHALGVTKPYKGNRKFSPHWTKFWKPIIIEHMVTKWGFIELSNIEADDACAIFAAHYRKLGIQYIVSSPDKDLRQIEGDHYDYKKLESEHINRKESLINLYSQVLIGDSTDNIGGCPKVGTKSPLLNNLKDFETREEMYSFVQKVYKDKNASDILEEQISLVYMLEEPDGIDIIKFPLPIPYSKEGEAPIEITQEDKIILPPVQSFKQ